MKTQSYWRRGQKVELARRMGMSQHHLYEILARRRGVSPDRAYKLQAMSELVLSRAIPWRDWLFNRSTTHPAFTGKPIMEANKDK